MVGGKSVHKMHVATKVRWLAALTGAAVWAAPIFPAMAQSANDYHLPAPSPSASPTAAGPVDDGIAPPKPVNTPTIVLPQPSASAVAPPPPVPVPERRRTVAPTPNQQRQQASAREATPLATAAPTPAPPMPMASGTTAVAPGAPVPVTSTPAREPAAPSTPLARWRPWLAAAGVLMMSGLVFAVWRRRQAPKPAPATLALAASAPTPEPPVPAPPPVPTPASRPLAKAVPPAPPPPLTDQPLVLRLEATRLSATLVAATLSYRLIVANAGSSPLTDIAIGGDMTSAHASRSMEEQFGLVGPEWPPLHTIALLEAGDEVAIVGEMRLALADIAPIRQGSAHLFVPLARFDAWATGDQGKAEHARAVFLVGQIPLPSPERLADPAAERLQPFRLDQGPRVYARIGQLALAMPGAV